MMKLLIPLLGLLVLTSSIVDSSDGKSSWNYSPTSSSGPKHWSSVLDSHGHKYKDCDGTSQSPINFKSVGSDAALKPLDLSSWSGKPITRGTTIKNNGHVLFFQLSGDSQQTLTLRDPNQNNKTYSLLQFHIHSPSEHTFGGSLRDMEVHMVHQSPEDQSILVIGVTFVANGNSASDFLNQFWDLVPSQRYKSGGPLPNNVTTSTDFDLENILPASRNFYTYSGSFTTPPCTEGVSWYVMQEASTMSDAQLSAFRDTIWTENNPAWDGVSQFVPIGTYRPVQPLNGRTVKLYQEGVNTAISAATINAAVNTASAIGLAHEEEDHHGDVSAVGVVGLVLGLIACILALIALAKGRGGGKRSADVAELEETLK